MQAEAWKKVPGWRLEVSDLGRVRNLAGRVLELRREKGTYRVRYTGADDDRTMKRDFSVASLVLHVFQGQSLRMQAVHRDGDRFNCQLSNLLPGKILHNSTEPLYLVPVVEAEADQARGILLGAGVPLSVVDAVLCGKQPDDWTELDRCIGVLDDAGVKGERIAAAMGFLPRVITRRKLSMGRTRKVGDDGGTLPGEAWRAVPGYRAQVSSLGRVRGPNGLLKGTVGKQRLRVSLWQESDGRLQAFTVANLVLHAFRGAPLTAFAKPLNGDMMDVRLANLVASEFEIVREVRKKDKPWTKEQDRALQHVSSWSEGAQITGHTTAYVKKRMAKLGIDLDAETGCRRGKQLQLPYRDMDALRDAVAVLEAQQVADRVINLGMRILPPSKGEGAMAVRAAEACMMALSDAGWSNPRIAKGLGVSRSTVSQQQQRLGLREPWPKGFSTRAGPIDPRQGEEWRDVPGFDYQVSNGGRVANSKGDLLAIVRNQDGRAYVGLRSATKKGARYTARVSRLVLAAFKPELSARQAAYLNGNPDDITPENLVPKRTLKTLALGHRAPEAAAPRGNLAHATLAAPRGSVPYFDPIWAEARKACPGGLDDHVREDLISDTVMLYLEGRASSIPEAFKLARREYNRIMGAWRETSLDSERGDNGFTLGHLLTSDGELLSSPQARSGRA